jgi:hypothetical protein
VEPTAIDRVTVASRAKLFCVVWMKPRYTSFAALFRDDARALVVLFCGVGEMVLMDRSLLVVPPFVGSAGTLVGGALNGSAERFEP